MPESSHHAPLGSRKMSQETSHPVPTNDAMLPAR
jgi:hypothetical protein